MTNTLSETARSLSKAQRRALVNAGCAYRPDADCICGCEWESLPPELVMVDSFVRLTSSGLALRAHILTEEQQP